jgi:hypothetical protein
MIRFLRAPSDPPSGAAQAPAPALSSSGRVSLRDPDGGRHVVEVLGRSAAPGTRSSYQITVDGWYHVGKADSASEVQESLDRVRRAMAAGWLPGDADLPD